MSHDLLKHNSLSSHNYIIDIDIFAKRKRDKLLVNSRNYIISYLSKIIYNTWNVWEYTSTDMHTHTYTYKHRSYTTKLDSSTRITIEKQKTYYQAWETLFQIFGQSSPHES